MERETTAVVALLQHRPDGLGWSEIAAEILEAGSAVEVWEQHTRPTLLDAGHSPLQKAENDLACWRREGLTVLTILDEEYPARLRDVHQAPPLLFGRGKVLPRDCGVSVVGSRDASERGLGMAKAIARALVSEGVTVVAGLAAGIDTAAHRAALEAGGRTVGVIGTGINQSYPASNRQLQEQIAVDGLVLSQFWPDATPRKHTFLMRNATMSGYGLATVVVEAGEYSGSRAQARMAVEHGRPVVLTDLVVERNEWAQEMLGPPGVHVADGVSSVVRTVQRLQEQDLELEQTLDNLLAGRA